MAHVTVPSDHWWKIFHLNINIKSIFKRKKKRDFKKPKACFKCTQDAQKHFIPIFY